MVKKIVSIVCIIGLAYVANVLSKLNPVIEFPIWAAVIGLIVGNIPKVNEYIKTMAHTEFFIKTGLILLGASINFTVIMAVGWRGLVQALIGVPLVFFFAWYVGKAFGLEDKMRAVMASALSICGVSAAIAAAGSVLAKKEQLTYVVALVILFALPLMILVPIAAEAMNLSPAVAGAWIGNNIDTTAAVTGAGTILGESALQVASVVKMAQNCMIGFAAFALALYFAIKVEKNKSNKPNKPRRIELWNRFPKFVLGFLAVSLLITFGMITGTDVKALSSLRKWFFALAFVCIGIGFSFKDMKTIGKKPLAVFAIATAFNTATALGIGYLLFNDYEI